MIFHVDANSFYASCERLFRPDLRDKPIAVLSNNDGIIVALTKECKALGLKRGNTYFKVKNFCQSNGVQVFSSNYTLYADMSWRLNSIYSLFAQRYEIYSIDESFLYLPEMESSEYSSVAHKLKEMAQQYTGIPVSVGIAPTKTLAKICNKLAKKNGGVFNWLDCDPDSTLKGYPVEDVWGIGRSKAHWLKSHGIKNSLELKNMGLDKAKKYLTLTGMNTVLELNGKNAIDFVSREKSQNICSSRSFRECVYKFEEIEKALSYFCSVAVKKMRDEKQRCTYIYVTLGTAAPIETEFNPKIHYFNGVGKKLNEPSSFLPDILAAATELAGLIFRPGYGYRKASVSLLALEPDVETPRLFETQETHQQHKQDLAMQAVDRVNLRYGTQTVKMATGINNPVSIPTNGSWELKRDFKSPNYTTRVSEFPIAR